MQERFSNGCRGNDGSIIWRLVRGVTSIRHPRITSGHWIPFLLDRDQITENILTTNYKAFVNLRLRKSHEMALSASQGFDINYDIVNNEDKDKYETKIERLKIVYTRLDEGVFLLDVYIMLHELF